MMAGPNLISLKIIVDESPVPVIASGGVSTMDDITAIKAMGRNVEGVILGKSLYEGKIDLRQANAAAS
jgi:phosphoribosylformimino-5-aminoimidazole carboxamide ribonucleotide (ProFAR) isomerase